jgi:two-component system, NarL family, response regulator
MSSDALRLLLVEDDELFRLGLSVRLKQELFIQEVIEAEDGERALAIAARSPFDLILLDIGLPGIGGIETCRQLKQHQPNLPILVLTSREDPELLNRLISLGVQGYCLKGIAAESLVLAVRSVIAGASWWDAAATQKIRQTMIDTASSPALTENPLTHREHEVLTLIAQEKTNSEIAKILYICAGTVRVHVHAILHKLQVNDRRQATQFAQAQNWFKL